MDLSADQIVLIQRDCQDSTSIGPVTQYLFRDLRICQKFGVRDIARCRQSNAERSEACIRI